MNIKELRNKLGISQQKLSDATGIPKPRIGQWETGNGKPKREDYDILANYFIEKGVLTVESTRKQNLEDFDVAASAKKTEATTAVILMAVSEILAKMNNQSAAVVVGQLEDLVQKRLNS